MAMSELSHFIRSYDGSLEASLCRQMIASFEQLTRFHKINGRGVRAGLEDSAWTELNVTQLSDTDFLGMFRSLVDAALSQYNHDVGLSIPIPNSPKISDLVLKRYRPTSGERFQLHFDSIHHLSNRYLVLLWYLNDVQDGGQTRFPQLGIDVAARAGRLLVFPPYWMYQHEGVPPKSQDKYILSTYLLFDQPVMP